MVGACLGGRPSRRPPSCATFSAASGGRYLATGSPSSIRPSSTSIMTAVDVIGLVLHAKGEDGIRAERLLGGRIAIADSLQMRELAATHDADHGARNLPIANLAAQGLADPPQARGRQADGLGL